jgi:hypothetical protein
MEPVTCVIAVLLFCIGRVNCCRPKEVEYFNSKRDVGHWDSRQYRADGGCLGMEKSFAREVFRPRAPPGSAEWAGIERGF